MPLTAVSGAASGPGGLQGVANGVFLAAALVFVLAYREVLSAASVHDRDVDLGIRGVAASLVVAFSLVVLVRALVAAPHV